MAYNNYGGYGNKGGGRPNQDRRREPPAPPEEIRPLPIPRDYVDQAENVIRGILGDYKKISTSKLRNIFSLVTDIYNVENLRTEKELSAESITALMMMRIRIAYEAGREETVKTFVRKAKLLEYIKGIGSDRQALIDFSHYMEALVAYHRFYIQDKEG